MDLELKEKFLEMWKKYFGIAELPIVLYYHKEIHNATLVTRSKVGSCLICELAKVRNGESLAYNAEAITCGGAKRYLGYAENDRLYGRKFFNYQNLD
jgi:uncharacterized protein (DUF169 family)